MANYKQYVPYYLNYPVVSNITLKPKVKREPTENIQELPLNELFKKIANSNYDFTFEYGIGGLNIKIGGELYSFEQIPHNEIIELILNIGKTTKDFNEIHNYMWLYIESDNVIDDAHEFYYFFLCKEDNIANELYSLSETPLSRIPDDVLIEKTSYFTSNELEDTVAHVRLLYGKWFRETVHGRIYNMKQKIVSEQERIERSGEQELTLNADDMSSEINMSILKELRLLRSSLNATKLLLFIVVLVIVYFVFIK